MFFPNSVPIGVFFPDSVPVVYIICLFFLIGMFVLF